MIFLRDLVENINDWEEIIEKDYEILFIGELDFCGKYLYKVIDFVL